MLVLVHKSTGKRVYHGDEIIDFRGDKATFVSGREPHKPSSTGLVYVKESDDSPVQGYYPSVFDLEWKDIKDA